MNDTDDWFTAERLTPTAYRISEGVIFNNYLLTGTDTALLIDASIGFGNLNAFTHTITHTPVTLLLTHTHWDHMGAAHQFEDVHVTDAERTPDGSLHPSAFGYGPDNFITDWLDAGRSLPDTFDPDTFEIPPVPEATTTTVTPGETIPLGGRTVELIATPGHSPGHLAVLDHTEQALYASDLLHHEYSLYIHFEGCDIHDYIDTLERVITLRDETAFTTLYLAHARPLADDDLTVLDDYLDGLHAIVAGDLDPEPIDDPTGPAHRYEIADHTVLTHPTIP